MFQAKGEKRYVEVIWTNSVIKEERQCTYNVTLRRVRAKIVAKEKQKVLHILSVSLKT
jgi:hypothetical protein